MGEEYGDSEQAKAAGIRKAKGEICAMFCADNYLDEKTTFYWAKQWLDLHSEASAVYPEKYSYKKEDNSLNRYFSLIGGNDPVCYYLGKNDRKPHNDKLIKRSKYQPSYGCNGFFYRASHIKNTNLDNYYPMDNAMEVPGKIFSMSGSIWHRTSDNLITFLKKRYKYARDLYCDRDNRRWKMLETREDYWNLLGFILSTVSVIPTLFVSIRGWWRIRDFAWFWHPIVCYGFLITYSILAIRNLFKHGQLFQIRCPAYR